MFIKWLSKSRNWEQYSGQFRKSQGKGRKNVSLLNKEDRRRYTLRDRLNSSCNSSCLGNRFPKLTITDSHQLSASWSLNVDTFLFNNNLRMMEFPAHHWELKRICSDYLSVINRLLPTSIKTTVFRVQESIVQPTKQLRWPYQTTKKTRSTQLLDRILQMRWENQSSFLRRTPSKNQAETSIWVESG